MFDVSDKFLEFDNAKNSCMLPSIIRDGFLIIISTLFAILCLGIMRPSDLCCEVARTLSWVGIGSLLFVACTFAFNAIETMKEDGKQYGLVRKIVHLISTSVNLCFALAMIFSFSMFWKYHLGDCTPCGCASRAKTDFNTSDSSTDSTGGCSESATTTAYVVLPAVCGLIAVGTIIVIVKLIMKEMAMNPYKSGIDPFDLTLCPTSIAAYNLGRRTSGDNHDDDTNSDDTNSDTESVVPRIVVVPAAAD